MKLFYSPGACSLGIHVVLEEIGHPFTLHRANIRGTDAERADLLAINPKGKVPALQRDDGRTITEYPVIARYLAETNPALGLWPAETDAALTAAEAMDYIAGTVHVQGFTRLFRPARFSPDEADHGRIKAQGTAIVELGYANLAASLGSNDWIGGTYSVADSALFFVEYWGTQRLGMTLPPPLAAHWARMCARPAVARALAAEGLTLKAPAA